MKPRWRIHLNRRPARASAAFSLLEMIGVVAVIAVLAATLLPAWIKRIDIATRNREVVQLAGISNSLVTQVLRGYTVPNNTTWSNNVANWSMLSTDKVHANARRYQRLYYFPQGASPSPLTFVQNSSGVAQPQKLRAVVVSILGGDALDGVNCPSPTGGTLDDTQFAALWDLADGARPTTGGWSWSGRGDDFLVQRIDYAPLFHRLILVNRDPSGAASFRINNSAEVYLPNSANGVHNTFYVDGTVVSLCDKDGLAMTRYVLTRDISFVFEEGMWRGQIMGGTEMLSQSEDFARKAAQFLAAEWYSGSKKGADQQTALTAMYSFMLTYTFWANLCPHFPQRFSSADMVPEYRILNDFGGNSGVAFLDNITGTGGLLNK